MEGCPASGAANKNNEIRSDSYVRCQPLLLTASGNDPYPAALAAGCRAPRSWLAGRIASGSDVPHEVPFLIFERSSPPIGALLEDALARIFTAEIHCTVFRCTTARALPP